MLCLMGIQYSCVSNKNAANNVNEVLIEDENQIIGFSFTKNIKNPRLFETYTEIINVGNYIFYEGVQAWGDVPFITYAYTFVNKKDTMEIRISHLYYKTNYFFDNIKFKKGKFNLKINWNKREYDKTYSKKGIDIFKNKETLLNTKIVYKPYGTFKGKTKKLKDIEFEYFSFDNKDITLEEK